MTVKKLSDSDKNEILNLYRETGETTSTLAEHYDVSNSTISRFLKITLPEEEYEELIQQKRAARTFGKDETLHLPLFSQPEPDISVAKPSVEVEPSPDAEPTPASTRLRRRSPAVYKPEETSATADLGVGLTNMSVDTPDNSLNLPQQLLDAPHTILGRSPSPINEDTGGNQGKPEPLDKQSLKIVARSPSPINENVGRAQGSQPQPLDRPASVVGSSSTPLEEDANAEASAIAQMLGEDLLDEDSEELMDLDDEDLEDLDEDDLDEDTPLITRRVPSETLVQVLPLSEAILPRTCYLVIDRASELITKPLRDFGELGQIPSQEIHQKTLPVFDNHRIARRFSTKRDRVIKVPDSRLLHKTRSQLQAKGITRLLVDGQVYSLLK